MRICFIGPLNSLHLQKLGQHILDQGHELHIITFKSTYSDVPELKKATIHTIEPFYSLTSKLLPQKSRQGLTNHFKKLIKQINPDIVHGHRTFLYGYYTATCGKYPKILSVWGEFDLGYENHTYFSRRITKKALKGVDLIHSDAEVTTEAIKKYGISNDKIVTIPVGVDLAKFNTNIEPIKPKVNSPVIISNRNLYRPYNIGLLIKAVPYIKEKLPEVKVIILGSGTEEGSLKKMASNLHLENTIEFIGFVPHQDMARWYRFADIYVSTSFTDGTHLSLLEAMACGAFPCVSDIPANRFWIEHGKNGLLSPVDQPQNLADNIMQGINNRELKNFALQYNVELVKNKGTWNKTTIMLDECYKKLMNHNRR